MKKTTKKPAEETQEKETMREFLLKKKAKDGKLNALGEWLLSGEKTGWYIRDEDMKYILK